MANLIKRLPDFVANQIKAGEVIQRPASVVKELLENAVDAGATKIDLVIKDAGKTLIQVSDNGCGMNKDDARLCFEIHATSKIHSADDLQHLHTKGFRGEALASIAAIAQVELKTKLTEEDLGTRIIVEGNKFEEPEAIACSNGSSFAVKNLFFNIPVRRNFLKSDATEYACIVEEFRRVALVCCDIEFTLTNNGNLVYKLPKANKKKRIMDLFGDNYNDRLVNIQESVPDVNIKGFICKPEYAKKTKGEQYFFANGRFIKSSYLHHAVTSAFQELIPVGTNPLYFIEIEVPTECIDVNIHPTKIEVKFSNENVVYGVLRACVRNALGKNSLMPSLDFDTNPSFELSSEQEKAPIKLPTIDINPEYNPFTNPNPKNSQTFPVSPFAMPHSSHRHPQQWEEIYSGIQQSADQLTSQLIPSKSNEDTQLPLEHNNEDNLFFQPLLQQYILTPVEAGLMIVDIAAARERILFEKYLHSNSQNSNGSQTLLFPQTIELSPADADLLREITDDVKAMGFDISDLGGVSFAVNGIPVDYSNEDNISETIESILASYKSNLLSHTFDSRHTNLAQSLARHLSKKIKGVRDNDEAKDLVQRLFSCSVPTLTPSGRKTAHILTIEELKRLMS